MIVNSLWFNPSESHPFYRPEEIKIEGVYFSPLPRHTFLNNSAGEPFFHYGIPRSPACLPLPQFALNFEKLIDATPDGRKRTTEARERIKQATLSFQQFPVSQFFLPSESNFTRAPAGWPTRSIIEGRLSTNEDNEMTIASDVLQQHIQTLVDD